MKRKRVLSLILAMVMVLMLFPSVVSAAEVTLTIHLNTANGESITLDGFFEYMSVDYVKEKIKDQTGFNSHDYRLVYNQRILENGTSLMQYDILSGNVTLDLCWSNKIELGATVLRSGQQSNVYFGNYQQSNLGETEPTGTKNVDWIENADATQNTQGPYYKKEPILWRVLSNKEGKLFLLADKNLDAMQYNESTASTTPVTWATGTVRDWLNSSADISDTAQSQDAVNMHFIDAAFSESERMAIADTAGVAGDDTTDQIFLLSKAEAENGAYGFTDDNSRKSLNTAYVAGGGKYGINGMFTPNQADFWWLSSYTDTGVYCVWNDGDVMKNTVSSYFGVRPAMNLNTAQVLFTTPAQIKTIAVGSFVKNGVYIPSGSERSTYQLTLRDSAHSDFAVEETSVVTNKGGTVSLRYSGAQAGENEYISAMIMDGDAVAYYGQLAQVTAPDGTVTFTVPADLECGTYRLKLFNEQINGASKTDFASDFQPVSLTVSPDKFTLGVNALSGYDTSNGCEDAFDYVYFGTYDSNPLKWRVLSANGNSGAYYENGTVPASEALFLLSEYALDNIPYNSGEYTTWAESEAHTWCNDTFLNNVFSTAEQNYFLKMKKFISSGGFSAVYADTFFFLCGNEIDDYLKADKAATTVDGSPAAWWLREDDYYGKGYFVSSDGTSVTAIDAATPQYARPAGNLHASKILFTAPAKGKAVEPGVLSKNEAYTIATSEQHEYKLTMIDSARNDFAVEETTASAVQGGTLSFRYSGAKTGENEYISAMILDENSRILYYGQLAESVSSETDGDDSSAILRSVLSEQEGETVTLTLPADLKPGTYTVNLFNEQINGADKTDFASGFQPVTLTVNEKSSGGGIGGTPRYVVKFNTNGGSEIDSVKVNKNRTVAEPKQQPTKDGYSFDGWYSDEDLTEPYDFATKVTKNITLYAKWKADESREPSGTEQGGADQSGAEQGSENTGGNGSQGSEWKNPFTDVSETHWFFDDVKFVNSNDLMEGVTPNRFTPQGELTRGMSVTILWRAEGEPYTNQDLWFTDVSPNSYYANAIRWATSKGLVNGISATEFAPDAPITREQVATLLYRYAEMKKSDMTLGNNIKLLSYTDFNDISDYAIDAMQYAVGSGLMKGKTKTTLNPKDTTTRSEIAAVLHRLSPNID